MGEGDLTRQPSVERAEIRFTKQSDGVGLVIGGVGKRAARERPLGFNDGVAFEEGDDVCERSAA